MSQGGGLLDQERVIILAQAILIQGRSLERAQTTPLDVARMGDQDNHVLLSYRDLGVNLKLFHLILDLSPPWVTKRFLNRPHFLAQDRGQFLVII